MQYTTSEIIQLRKNFIYQFIVYIDINVQDEQILEYWHTFGINEKTITAQEINEIASNNNMWYRLCNVLGNVNAMLSEEEKTRVK